MENKIVDTALDNAVKCYQSKDAKTNVNLSNREGRGIAMREGQLDIDFGLNTVFNGSKYKLVMAHSLDEYPIGGLICEYMRLTPTDIKDLILSCDGLDKEGTRDNYAEVFMQLHQKLYDCFPPVIGTMIAVEFINAAQDWFKAVQEGSTQMFLNKYTSTYDSIRTFILEDTGYDCYGGETVLQVLLTLYYMFAENYVLTKVMFNNLMENDECDEEKQSKTVDLFASLFGEYMDMQHIDYRLILTENGIESLYTIKSSFSLLIFDLAHTISTDTNIVKCKNCGHYFVQEGRSNTVYCSYPLRDNKKKTCKDIGAQLTRANKEKTDVATREYRRVYMRYKMMTNRHPNDTAAAEKLSRLTTEVRDWRNKLAHGRATTEEFLAWLEQFKEEGKSN